MGQLLERIGNLVATLINAVMQPLAQPLRQFHLTVGHSTVSAAGLIALAILGSILYLDLTIGKDYRIVLREAASSHTAQARYRELLNKEKELQLEEKLAGSTPEPLGRFDEAGLGIDATKVTITIFPAKGARTLRVEWGYYQKIEVPDGQGGTRMRQNRTTNIKTFDIALVDGQPSPAIQSFIMTSADFGEAWAVGNPIDFVLKQYAEDGRSVSYRNRPRLAVPSPSGG